MAKTWIIDSSDGSRIPFLRGILARSLHDAGLKFDKAYEIAATVRQELGSTTEISSHALRDLVLRHLKKHVDTETYHLYELGSHEGTGPISVVDSDQQITPFSLPHLSNRLDMCGLSTDKARKLAAHVFRHLSQSNLKTVTGSELGRIVHERLLEDSPEVARRYLAWAEYRRSRRPLILLLGGTTGSGKSTVATEAAHQLGVVRIQSTDMLREVMRMMIPPRLLPVLHESSFDAWKVLPGHDGSKHEHEKQVCDGYANQANLLSVACEAVIQRALREGVSLIVEGVHVQPALFERLKPDSSAIVVPIMLAVLRKGQLRKQLLARKTHAPRRDAQGHLAGFESIWQMQSYLLSEADRAQIPIVENDSKEKALRRVMGTILDALAETFHSKPEKVFAKAG